MCQTLKEHNNGKGCKKRSTQKKCKKTCGLCDPVPDLDCDVDSELRIPCQLTAKKTCPSFCCQDGDACFKRKEITELLELIEDLESIVESNNNSITKNIENNHKLFLDHMSEFHNQTTIEATPTPTTSTAGEMVTLLISGLPFTSKVEIIKENNTTEVCETMADFPIVIQRAAGSVWNDGGVVICGGVDNSNHRRSDCYTLKNGKWQQNSQNLQTERSNHALSNIGKKIWITGGYNYGLLASTEIIHPDGNVTPGPPLTKARHGHCQVSHDETTFIIGGYTSFGTTENTVLKFNSSNLNNNPIEETPTIYSRAWHTCTILKSPLHDGRPLVIVVGGVHSGVNKAEVWDFSKEGTSWQEIGNLPENMYGASMTTTSKGDNVILTQNRNIYTLSITGSEYKWIKLDEELSISRRYHLQFLVPASMIQC